MKLAIPSCIAFLLIIASGIHRSSWSGNSSEETFERALDDARTRLKQFPDVLGSWRIVMPGLTYGDLVFERKEDYPEESPFILTRQYENIITGEHVILMMVYGKARHISVHTLDHSTSQIRYSLLSRPEPITVSTGTRPAVFRTSRFMKINEGKERGPVRIFWAWSEGDEWEAPEYPRLAFEDAAGLYKMYVFAPIDGDAENEVDSDHPAIGFIEAFLSATSGNQSNNGWPEK